MSSAWVAVVPFLKTVNQIEEVEKTNYYNYWDISLLETTHNILYSISASTYNFWGPLVWVQKMQ
jgi:hypothetical protein